MTKNLNALFLVTLIFATLSEIRADVLVGPILFEESKYFLLTNSTWTEAEQEAQRMGGHLATIETVEENIFVFRTFSEYDNVERNLWIGLNDFLIEDIAVIPMVKRALAFGISNDLRGVEPTPWDVDVWNIKDWWRQ